MTPGPTATTRSRQGHGPNETLILELRSLVSAEREATALVLAHLAEVDARQLFRPAGYSTMHEYCMDALHLSDDSAYKRMRAARAARQFPQLFAAIADGRLHVSGLSVLAPHLTEENVDALLREATHRRKRDIEVIVARLAPRPDLPDAILARSTPETSVPEEDTVRAAGDAVIGDEPAARVQPLAPERFGLQMTISGETREKLEWARALMRHRNPSGDLAVVIDAALDALITKLEKETFAVTDRPRAGKAPTEDADPRYIPADVKRAVFERDQGQCTFVSADGVRCAERGFLELDHVTMVCHGGKPTVEGLRLRCKAHNQHAAEEALGEELVRAKREAAARDRDVTRALRGLGFKADETRRAMSNTPAVAASTFEERLRVALAELTRTRGTRCSEGAFDSPAMSARAMRWMTVLETPATAAHDTPATPTLPSTSAVDTSWTTAHAPPRYTRALEPRAAIVIAPRAAIASSHARPPQADPSRPADRPSRTGPHPRGFRAPLATIQPLFPPWTGLGRSRGLWRGASEAIIGVR